MRESNVSGMCGRLVFPSFLGLVLLLALSFACGSTPSSPVDGASTSGSGDVPELTDEMIRERINFAYVRKIPKEDGEGDPMNWRFIPGEPKEITIVDKKVEGDHATVILDIKTSSGPRATGPRSLAGQVRTEWQLRTGWVLRQWEIVDTENISMKYKNLPKPPADNSNR
jgi:hypothetical protein